MLELQPGAVLLHGQYIIERFLNSGGFGMTYLASDSLQRRVVVKECFPQLLCQRFGNKVCPRTKDDLVQMNSIVRHFIREAHRLAELDHPNIVGIHQVFEENKTAYIVLDFIDGIDLLKLLEEHKPIFGAQQIRSLLITLLHATKVIHNHGLLHRDISPDNILLDQMGEPVLIDFGAALEKKSIGGPVVSSLMVVKDGYSPHEFYQKDGEQGPFSDLYCLGATFYHLITGESPPNSQERIAALAIGHDDPYVPLVQLPGVCSMGEDLTSAIDTALKLNTDDRFQSAHDWLLCIDPKTRSETALHRAQSDEGIIIAIKKLMADADLDEIDKPKSIAATAEMPTALSSEPDPMRQNHRVLVQFLFWILSLGKEYPSTTPEEVES